MSDNKTILRQKLLNLFSNYGWMLLCYLIFFMGLGILEMLFPSLELHKYQQGEIDRLLEENPWKFVVMAIIAAPILEEGMFRSLVKPSPNDLIFFLCCWLWLIALTLIPAEVNWFIKFSFLILLILLSFIFLRELIPDAWKQKICDLANQYYISVWILTSVVFGVVHIFNYVEAFEINFVLVLLIFPRIIAGFFFGKVKIENGGLIWPILMHVMNNGVVTIFLLPRLLESL